MLHGHATRLIDPLNRLLTHLLKRTFQRASCTKKSLVVKKAYNIRKENDIHTAEYYFENGLRKVKPYHFHFRAYAKTRMYGSTVLDIFLKEYRGRTESYYRYAIEKGFITVNQQRTTPDTVIEHHDLLSHAVHRHEPPVTDQPIDIIYQNEDLFVINKPASIQVHPSGRYRHNTILHIMRKELGYDILFPANRLDRMTSGLMLISKNAQAANRLGKEMRTGNIQKEYICRVLGEFPAANPIICQQPIKQLAHTVAFNYIHPQGKPCITLFERISFNGRTSLVRCQPLSGRTHQIRVHLRYLGYPIANDPIYGYGTAWTQYIQDGQAVLDPNKIIQRMIETATYDYMDDDPDNETGLPRCDVCNVPVPQLDPVADQLALWLHAYKYQGDSWAFETPDLPKWAQLDYREKDVIVPASF